ncbi:hypothetical protein IJ076_02425 [Candidatus Saccharibacteria bacterium]|nr:hypothetical protein [Candidatus Saccharibacteria bacterium]
MSITKETFETLMALDKRFVDEATVSLKENWTKDIESKTTRDKFQLDYRRSKIEIRKYSFNHRTRTSIVLVRYCSLKRHTNPDGKVFEGPHIHLFCEGYDDKIAFSVKDVLSIDPETSSKEDILAALLDYCHIEKTAIQTTMEIE